MKKLLFLLVFIHGFTFSQMKPGIDYMPQIAFFDFVVNAIAEPQNGDSSVTLINLMRTKNW